MATITSVASGNWSVAGTWDSGVPVDGDTVVIASGHSVVFDVDQSGFANGIAGLTITGTLSVSTSTTSYLKMKAATTISGAGTFNVGTSGTPIPFAVKFTLTGGSGWYVQGSGGLTMGVYGAEPTYTYAKLSGAESAGATRLEIDTDLTGDIWAVGDTIHIDNINKARQSEARVITSITSTYIDISTGLSNSKIEGSFVILIARNVNIIGLGANVLQGFNSKIDLSGGGYTSDSRLFVNSNSHGSIITGGVFYDNGDAVRGVGNIVTGTIFSNNGTAFNGANYNKISDIVVTASTYGIIGNSVVISGVIIAGCTSGVYNSAAYLDNSELFGCSYGVNTCNIKITSCNLFDNTYDIRESIVTAHNTLFGSTTENYMYAGLPTYSESLDHDQTAGAFKAWTKGGITTSVATPVPTGLTASYQIALENASGEGFFKRHLNVPAGKTINITLYLRKSASMTYLPRAYVHELDVEPISNATGVLHTFTMTDSVDTWESDTYEYTNSAAYDVLLDVTFVGKNATGYVYGQVVDTFAGGGISKARLLGGV